jgi:two-component system, sporulation sensor kinase E
MKVKEPSYVTESKKRCKDNGMNPKDIPTCMEKLDESELARKKREFDGLRYTIKNVLNEMFQHTKDVPYLLCLSDNEGYLIDIFASNHMQISNSTLGITEGVKYTEEVMGTNTITLSLQLGIPTQLVGEHHYHEYLAGAACYTVPIQSNGKIIATISILTFQSYHSPLILGLLSSAVSIIQYRFNESLIHA